MGLVIQHTDRRAVADQDVRVDPQARPFFPIERDAARTQTALVRPGDADVPVAATCHESAEQLK